MRVYIPATLAALQALVDDGEMVARSATAFAVTPALREAYAHGDDDELAELRTILALPADAPLPRLFDIG